jgi:hypothetical protein
VSVQSSSSFVQEGRDFHTDLLSQVLRELRLDSATFRSLRLRGAWSLRFDGPLRGVHIVVSGRPQLRLDDGMTCMLAPGDLIVLPRADAHTMSSAADVRRPSYSSLKLAETSPDGKSSSVRASRRPGSSAGCFSSPMKIIRRS